jgi:predicted chitinase
MAYSTDRKAFFDAVRRDPFGGSLTQGQVNGMNFLLDTWERHFAKQNPNDGTMWLSYALATTYHESAATMRPIEEYGKGAGHSYGEPTGPYGQCYYGRGHVQLTWEENYIKGQDQLKPYGVNAPLHREPELMLNDETSSLVLYDGMIDGWYTGVGLPKFFDASKRLEDPVNARKIVNGLDHAEEIARTYWSFKTAVETLSVPDVDKPDAEVVMETTTITITAPVGSKITVKMPPGVG